MFRICINVCVILYHYYQQFSYYFSILFCMANTTNWCWEWYFHENLLYKFWFVFLLVVFTLYKVNWICFLTSKRLKRSWADSTFNIQHFMYMMLLCDVCYLILLLYTHKFIYFPPFSRCSLCDFYYMITKELFSISQMVFSHQHHLSSHLLLIFSLSVLGFFLWSMFLCPACWNNKVFFPFAVVRNGVSSFFSITISNVGDQMGSTEMMNNTIFRLPNPFLLKHYNTLIVIPDPQLNLFLFLFFKWTLI